MKKILLTGVAFAALSSGVQAADLGGRRVSVAAAITAPTSFTWTGFYAGLHAGYGSGNTAFEAPTGFGPLDVPNHRFQGAMLGGQFGWNYQVGQFVYGLEGTLAWAGLSGSADGGSLVTGGSIKTKANWIATMGPRLGFAFDRAMIYAKGGVAAAGFNTSMTDPSMVFSGSTAVSSTRAGWFVGAGVEYAFAPNWSARIEYNYMNFGRGQWLGEWAPGITLGVPAKQDIHTVTVGVNYLFNTAGR